ncbi:U32 family peptidase [Anaerococcus sp. AGMB00486]|uniref:U32 family peptidase n=2 Tax=Anaerococcus TaxID=165779 RepID=A0ABX2N7E2_9FIRM|nr:MULTISPECIES: U32 family peptidase [Anaerococcus]MSS76908.1 U32 family peptidase [Anaerococcus porci]NVF10606.1 U32 family peptidase [Anaerococcus faecalis]
MNKEVELLAPAGDFEKLKAAIKFGANAVYMAGNSFGLRKNSKNFDSEELKAAVDYAHNHNVRCHITMNIVPHDNDLDGIVDYIKFLDKIGVDALIISDPGIFMIAKENSNIDLHISTQASVTNSHTINFWYNLGAKRVILARELSLDEIIEIRKNVPKDLEIECFIHGAMCISYSGRCLLSNYMTGRDSNRGDCAHACRWKYSIQEEKRPGEYYPIEEDENGTFIMNSKDLCLIDEIDKLIEAGIDSFKIEGRMKTVFYVATVIRSYRQAINAYYKGTFNEKIAQKYFDEIKKASHRHFTKGFFYGRPGKDAQIYENSSYIRNYDFIAVVLDYDKNQKIAKLEERNKFILGDKVEIFGNNSEYIEFKINNMKDSNGNDIDTANKAKQIVYIKIDHELQKGDIVRREIK